MLFQEILDALTDVRSAPHDVLTAVCPLCGIRALIIRRGRDNPQFARLQCRACCAHPRLLIRAIESRFLGLDLPAPAAAETPEAQ